MTLNDLRNLVATLEDFPGHLQLVVNDDDRLRDAFVDFEVVGRDEKDKHCNVGTPVLLVRAGS